jgi:hypothetical protein
MSRLPLVLCAGTCILATSPTLMTAQDKSYDESALRIDDHQGTMSIVRGVSGTVVGKIGVFRGSDLASVVSPSPNAVAEAKIFQRDYKPGTLLASLGIATMGAAIGAYRIPDINTWIPSGLTVASLTLIAYGATKLESAYRALSKAIWWYNRDLARQ